AVGDAKSWKTSLDKKVKGAKGSFEFQNPSYQIDEYLRRTPVLWGILTNGRFWRIYHRETSYKLDSYYEIDLVTILEKNDIEGFKYFYLFFRLNAFIKDASGKNFLERVKEGSIAYAKKLGANLQENVYKAMKILSEGFFEWNDNGLLKNEGDLKEVQDNTLKLLYRLLFIFYAESLKLLDRDNPEYKKLSLLSIKSDISKKIDNRELVLPVTTNYWNKLNDLFALINEGSESENFRIPKDLLYIPAYNGGLFDPKRNIFLHNKKIGDAFIAKAIDLMAREGKDFIDYSTLGTRQLGSIYEGLLEYKLKVADEDLVAVKEKGHEKWVTKKEAEGKKTFDEIKAGAIYLATDKGERKATGSYYTPDYIVKYIVRNTLEPILDEKRAAWKEKGLGERPFLHDILGIRVLDPAMGSGHFLVEACEFLANKLVEAWGEARPEELESEEVAEHDVHWARREVVRHCIFGVDLNPMAVELAKLSLWLETVAANKPLTFLDHHLKVGNSLIGAQVRELKTLPSKEKKEGAEGKKQLKAPTLWDFTVKKHFEELLAKYGEFAAHPDDDLKSVKQKEQEYDALQKSELNRRLHELANIWTATYFGAAPPPDEYAEMQNEMNPKDFPDWGKWRGREWFAEAQRLAGEKRFFHWELEFPESFYEKGAPKENPGWDAVVGNPPYVSVKVLTKPDKDYYIKVFKSADGQFDLYGLFIEQGIKYSKNGFGFITSNTFLENVDFEQLRNFILQECTVKEIIDFGETVFEDANLDVVVSIFEKERNQEKRTKNKVKIALDSLENFKREQNFKLLTQKFFSDFPASQFKIKLTEELILFFKKIEQRSEKLGDFLNLNRGIETGSNDSRILTNKLSSEYREILVGEDIDRYQINFVSRYMPFDKNDLSNFKDEKMYLQPKIFIQRIRNLSLERRLIATFDDLNYFALNTLRVGTFKGNVKNYSLFYLLSILNSNLINYYFKKLFHNKDIYAYQLEQIPIRRISFTTPPAHRAALFEEAKALYSAEAPDSQKISDFVGARLEAKPEE
ncbi:MAG: TaqI-like C-terminal specificity domain-containing protein, partial [Candidatus Methanoperedens sp.]